jgi:hypothetical protein
MLARVLVLLVLFSLVVPAIHGDIPGYVLYRDKTLNLTVQIPVVIAGGDTSGSLYSQTPRYLKAFTPPVLTLTYPFNGTEHYNTTVPLIGSVLTANGLSRVEYSFDGGSWQSVGFEQKGAFDYHFSANLTASDGNHTLTVRATDKKGLRSEVRVWFSVISAGGEWRVYRVPFPIKFFGYNSQAVFYTDTGFKVVIKAEGDGASYREHRRDPLTNPLKVYVYDPQGRLYASSYTIGVGQGKTIPGKLDFSYEVWDADYNPDYTLYYYEVWQASRGLSTPRIYYSEDDGGWLHIKNLKVWLYEPKNLQRSYSITKSLVHCSYDDDDWGVFTGLYQVYSIGSISKSCYFQHPVITDKLVLYGDKEKPKIIPRFYRATPFVYAKTKEKNYDFDFCWNPELIYGDKKTCPQDRYRTIYHQTFPSTEVTRDNVVLRATDDSGYKRTTRLETYRRKRNEIDGWKSINDAFSAPSPAVTVYIRKQGGSWVTAGRYTFEYPYNVHISYVSSVSEYYSDRSINVGTEYFYASAKSLGLIPGWNTIEAKAVDWTGRDSGVVTVGSIYYDPKPPWAVWILPNPKTYFKDDFEDGNLNGWSFSGRSWGISTGYKSNYGTRSPRIWRGQTTCIYRNINVPNSGLVTFWWKSSGPYTTASFYIDGQRKLSRGYNYFTFQQGWVQTVEWREESVEISQGTHTLKWCYSKSTYWEADRWDQRLSLDNIKIVEPIKTPVFDVSARLRDDWGIAKVEAMVEQNAEIEANGKIVTAGQWLTVASFSQPKGKTDITVSFKVYSLGGQRERVHIRITDEAGNVREYVRDYYIDAPPYARLTSPKPGSTIGPEYNIGDFEGEAFWSAGKPERYCNSWGYCWGASDAVYVRVNGGSWYKAAPLNKRRWGYSSTWIYDWGRWRVSANKALFKPNTWNTIEVKVKDTLGREAVYTYKVYYKEPNTIVWNFDSGDYSKWTINGYTTGRSRPNAAYTTVTGYETYFQTRQRFIVDGVTKYTKGGCGVQKWGWTKSTAVTIPAGVHTFEWRQEPLRCTSWGTLVSVYSGNTRIASVRLGLSRPYILTYYSKAWKVSGGCSDCYITAGAVDDIVMIAQ